MPIGIQRLNAKKSQPNDRIVFIKPLKGPDEAVAQDFLERIAAQCLPVMREHHLSVMSLEEYEPNAEFVGRNFNAGEVVQLVLKARFTGHWLPFDYVQMVMMHELAHCKQMNHSRAFWAVRNQYADQMRALWARGYQGEGLWGRGALLATGEWERNTVREGEQLPEHLCGGTYRSKVRKRKAKKVLTYQERKEKRILKKFGANGTALGEDVAVKRQLEKGRTNSAKPRVAGSARGRELRAAAALARFDKNKKEVEVKAETVKIEDDDETASGSETESSEDYDDGRSDALDINGQRLLDAKGQGMIKICEDENPEDQDAQNELRELQSFGSQPRPNGPSGRVKEEESATGSLSRLSSTTKTAVSNDDASKKTNSASKHKKETKRPDLGPKPIEKTPTKSTSLSRDVIGLTNRREQPPAKIATLSSSSTERNKPTKTREPPPQVDTDRRICSVCSYVNTEGIPTTCPMCGNVLDVDKVVGSWACTSRVCAGSTYMNSGDAGVCGVCGERKA